MYGSTPTEIGYHTQIKEHKTKEMHEDQIDPTTKLQQ